MCPLVLNFEFVADSVIDIFFACGHFQISSNQIWGGAHPKKTKKNQSLHQNRQIGIGFFLVFFGFFFGFLKFPNWHWFFLAFFGFFWHWFWPEF